MARLQASGLIVQTVLGNQKHYRANANAPIFAELCGIVFKMLGPADALRLALAPLADEVELALLYGSVAKRSPFLTKLLAGETTALIGDKHVFAATG